MIVKVSLRNVSIRMEPQHLRRIHDGQALNVAHVLLHGLTNRDVVASVEAK